MSILTIVVLTIVFFVLVSVFKSFDGGKNAVPEPLIESTEPTNRTEDSHIYVNVVETETYVHLWRHEVALNLDVEYLGRFEKWNVLEFKTLLDKARQKKGVIMPFADLSEGMRNVIVEAMNIP